MVEARTNRMTLKNQVAFHSAEARFYRAAFNELADRTARGQVPAHPHELFTAATARATLELMQDTTQGIDQSRIASFLVRIGNTYAGDASGALSQSQQARGGHK